MQVHRFGDQVAISIGTGSTVYMSAERASDFAEAIIQVVDELDCEVPFSESKVGTYSVNHEID